MSTIIESIERDQLRRVPRFQAGDRVRVHFQVVEGSRSRTQVFEGVVLKRQGNGARETFTVRKQSFGVGVERTFPLHSPKIERLEVAGRGDVRRAKLYYLRDRVGKAARVAERRWGITDDVFADEAEGAVDSEGVAQEEAEPEVVEPEGEEDAGAEAAEATEPQAEAESETPAEAEGEPQADAEQPEPTAEAAEPEAEGEEPDAGGEEPGTGSEEDEASAKDS